MERHRTLVKLIPVKGKENELKKMSGEQGKGGGVEVEKEKEILRQQLELLAEKSKGCKDEVLPQISREMLNIATYLNSSSIE